MDRLEWDGYCGDSRVLLGQGIRENLHRYMAETGCSTSRRCLAIVDPEVANIWGTRVASWLEGWKVDTWVMPAGESSKSLDHLAEAAEIAAKIQLDKTCCILAVGGGRVGDLAGFLAAIYLRGIPWVCVPTTLLAHDSCLGGKVAVNHGEYKNMIGAFHMPKLVAFDTMWLATLPKAVFYSGYAEAIKHALLVEPSFLNWLWSHRLSLLDPKNDWVPKAILKSMQIKRRFVEKDVKESRGQRVLLHLGHTFAHALEVTSDYRYRHGDALALGLQMALVLSQRVLGIPEEEARRVRDVLLGFELPTTLLYPVEERTMLAALRKDRKAKEGSYTFVGLRGLGDAVLMQNVPEAEVRAAFRSVQRAEVGSRLVSPKEDSKPSFPSSKKESVSKLSKEKDSSATESAEPPRSIVLPIAVSIGDEGL